MTESEVIYLMIHTSTTTNFGSHFPESTLVPLVSLAPLRLIQEITSPNSLINVILKNPTCLSVRFPIKSYFHFWMVNWIQNENSLLFCDFTNNKNQVINTMLFLVAILDDAKLCWHISIWEVVKSVFVTLVVICPPLAHLTPLRGVSDCKSLRVTGSELGSHCSVLRRQWRL